MPPHAILQQAEKAAISRSLYTGSGRPNPQIPPAFRTRLKSAGPPAIITATLITFLVLFAGFGSQLGSQIQDLFAAKTDNAFISYQLKARRITQQMLNGKRELPNDFIEDFKKQGITIDADDAGGYRLTFKDQSIDANNFDTAIKDNIDFREAFTRAKHGRAANYYDESAENFYQKLGLTRNIFESYEQTDDAKADSENYHQTINNEFSDSSDMTINTAEERNSTDEDGNTTTERVESGEQVTTKNVDGDTHTAKSSSYITSISNKVAATTDTLNVGCAVLKVGNLVSTAVAAASTYQAIHYFLNNAESLSKTKAGDGNQSAINSVLNFLTEPTTTNYTDVSTGEEKTITGAPIESQGAKSILADETPNKELVRNFSLERGFIATLSAISTNQLATTTCDVSQAAGAVISLATLATGGGFVKATIGTLIRNVAGATALQFTISGVLAGLIPMVASTMFQNVAENITGVPAGELFANGASAGNSASARANSGLAPSSAKSALAYQPAYQSVIAEESEQDRTTRSPFDASSPNTFLGALSLKLLPINTTSSSTLSTISQIASSASNSLSRVVRAAGEDSSYLTTFGDCPTLESIGAVGDIYCNPIVTADLSTVNLDPDDPTYRAVITPNLIVGNNSVKIKDGSNLGNYIMYCAERESPFGAYDANIAEAFQTSLGPADNLPYLNDVIDIVNAAENVTATPWATGSICVNSEDNPYWESEFKYYQHYIEENRILEQMGAYATSNSNPVTAYKDDYYSKHPLDNSRVGILRRITGFTATQADTVLALLDYSSYLANYHPEEAVAFNAKNSPADYLNATKMKKTQNPAKTNGAQEITTQHFSQTFPVFGSSLFFAKNADSDFLTPPLRNRSFAV